MPAAVAAFTPAEAAALAVLTASFKDILSNKDTNQAGLQAVQLALAVSVYTKTAVLPALAVTLP